MLKFLLPMVTLLILPSWHHMIHLLMFLSLISMSFFYSQSPLSLSNWSTLDQLNSPLITLSLWITSLMLIASYPIYQKPHKPLLFLTTCSILLLFLLISFSTNNMIMFYIFFEAALIPTLTLILIWGYQPERLQASMYMMLYTITASLPLLSIIMFIMYEANSLNMFILLKSPFNSTLPAWWVMMMTAFMVKMPMYGVHLWLPKAHVEAPVAGSMILAGILLKLGSYGLLRLSSLFLPVNASMSNLVTTISLIGAVMTGLTCMRQSDLKALIAYSSVAHMALITAGIMSNTVWGWEGALTMMLAHGLCSSALFAMANANYETTYTRSMFLTKGMLALIPSMSIWWFTFTASNLGAPPSMNLMAEILLLTSILHLSPLTALPLAITSFIAAAYSLILYTSTQHGQPPSFSNPQSMQTTRIHSLMMLHAIPLILLFLKAAAISLWL